MNAWQVFTLCLQALIALPKIGALIEDFISKFTAWKHDRDLAEVQAKITAAKVASQNAKTDEDRINAAKAWQDALKKPRPEAPAN